jgi:hypothetical protein
LTGFIDQNLSRGRKETHMNRLHKGSVLLAAGVLSAALGREAAAQTGPFQYFAVTPCRLADTRDSSYNSGAFLNGPPSLQGVVTRAFFVKGKCGIPNTAKAVSLNATVASPTFGGWLALWPAGIAWTGISTVNFPGGPGATPNGAVVPLSSCTSPCGDLNVLYGVTPSANTTDLVLDITGYFQ